MILGKIIKDFSPREGNARNSEGSFIRMKDGRIAFAFSRYNGGAQDHDRCDLAVTFSSDEGETFSEEEIILTAENCKADNIMSVSLLQMQDGSIGIFYCKKHGRVQCVSYMRRTYDFKTFSEEIRCNPEDGYFVLNNDRVRRLSSGRIIFPAAYHKTIETLNGNVIYMPAATRFYCSDDDGYTWKRLGEELVLDCTFSKTGLQEPGIEELDDGKLYAYFRTDLCRQYFSCSSDGGETWTKPAPSQFTAPDSPMSTKRLASGHFALVYNPIPLHNWNENDSSGRLWTWGRTPLVLRISDGNISNIGEIYPLEDDGNAGFCYCAIFETEDDLLFAYCAGGKDDRGPLNRLRIKKILKSEIVFA